MNFIFTNPILLYLLPLAAMPLILHLISRGKPTQKIFPSIRFIKLGKVPSNERKKLTDILLLILRTLILLSLILFFAGIDFKHKQNIEQSKCAIIIDVSVSAHHHEYFKNISEKLKTTLSNLPDTTEFLLIYSSNKIVKTLNCKNSSDVLAAIHDVPAQIYSPNHREALQKGSEYIGKPNQSLIIVSIMDSSGFEQSQNISLPTNTNISIINAELSKNNINILGAQFVKNNPSDSSVRISTKVSNEGDYDINSELKFISKNKTEIKPFTLGAHQVGNIVLNTEIQPDEPITINLTQKDEYSADNTYYCQSPKNPIAEVLLLHAEKPQASENLFFEEAFKISANKMIEINYHSLVVTEFNYKNLKKPDFLIMSGCAEQLSAEQLSGIHEWHKNGMHIIITPNEEYRRAFSLLSSAGIISQNAIKKVGTKFNTSPVFFNNLNEKSPYTSIFLKDGVNDFISIPIHQYIKINYQKNAEILLTTENDDPILLTNRTGNGICFLFTTVLDPTWTDLPITATFLPLLRQVVNVSYQTISKSSEEYITPNAVLPIPSNEKFYFLNEQQITIDSTVQFPIITPKECGIYKIADKNYIVNISRKHSRPDIISNFELKNMLQKNTSENKNEDTSIQDNSLKKILLYLLFLFIFFEILLHNVSFKNTTERAI